MIFPYDFTVVAFVLSGNSNFVAKIISTVVYASPEIFEFQKFKLFT